MANYGGLKYGWQIMEDNFMEAKLWRPKMWMANYGGWQIMQDGKLWRPKIWMANYGGQ